LLVKLCGGGGGGGGGGDDACRIDFDEDHACCIKTVFVLATLRVI